MCKCLFVRVFANYYDKRVKWRVNMTLVFYYSKPVDSIYMYRRPE